MIENECFLTFMIQLLPILPCEPHVTTVVRQHSRAHHPRINNQASNTYFCPNPTARWCPLMCGLPCMLTPRHVSRRWVAVLSPLLLRERPGRFTFVAIPLCLLGVCLIARPGVSSSTHLRLAGIVVGVFQVP